MSSPSFARPLMIPTGLIEAISGWQKHAEMHQHLCTDRRLTMGYTWHIYLGIAIGIASRVFPFSDEHTPPTNPSTFCLRHVRVLTSTSSQAAIKAKWASLKRSWSEPAPWFKGMVHEPRDAVCICGSSCSLWIQTQGTLIDHCWAAGI